MSERHIPRIAILASGSGTTAHAYARGIQRGLVKEEICMVIASKPSAGILDLVAGWNHDWGFDTRPEVISNKTHPAGPRERGQSQESSEAICELLASERIDLVLQLGYMIIGNGPYIEEWGFVPGRDTSVFDTKALNWHPGLLPLTADTYGVKAARKMMKAYRNGEIEEAAHTVHAVAQEIDGGPIFAEHPVPILPRDTAPKLFDRTQGIEKTATLYVPGAFLRQQEEYREAA